MLNFEDIEHLVSHMFENLDNTDNLVSVISDKSMVIEIMKELLEYENVILNSCDIDDDCNYDREYLVSLNDDVDSDYWYVNVEKIYYPDKDKYFSTGGYILFHEDVNSKALVGMQNNEYMPLDEYDWFVIDEDAESKDYDNETYEDEPDEDCESEHNYMVNGESVTKEEFDTYVSKFKGTDKDDSDSNNKEYHITIKGDLDISEADRIINHMEKRMADMMREFYRPSPLWFYWYS